VARALVSYDHEGLTFANENYMGGMIMAFEIRDWKTFGANTCGETEQYMLYKEGGHVIFTTIQILNKKDHIRFRKFSKR